MTGKKNRSPIETGMVALQLLMCVIVTPLETLP
jgi:hypothetical protein